MRRFKLVVDFETDDPDKHLSACVDLIRLGLDEVKRKEKLLATVHLEKQDA